MKRNETINGRNETKKKTESKQTKQSLKNFFYRGQKTYPVSSYNAKT